MDEYLDVFYRSYQKLTEKERNYFAKICSKLLSCNFLTSIKQADVEDYYFVVGHLELFIAYFLFMDYDLSFDATNNVISLVSNENVNRLNLRLKESIVLLILRLLYDEKMREVSLVDKIIVVIGDIHNKLITSGLQDRRISKTDLRQVLALFKRYHLIDTIDRDYSKDDSRIVIYPTILYAVKMENITSIYDKLQSYQKGDGIDEEISEN